VHDKDEPAIVYEHGNPKRAIGKCPNRMSASLLDDLVNEAITPVAVGAAPRFHKRLYVVHKGCVYEAMTSDRGQTYHGYPYKGRLSSATITKLREMATKKMCLDPVRDKPRPERRGRIARTA